MNCSNCGSTDSAAPRSWDLDLPVLILCNICAFSLGNDPELFEDMRRRGSVEA